MSARAKFLVLLSLLRAFLLLQRVQCFFSPPRFDVHPTFVIRPTAPLGQSEEISRGGGTFYRHLQAVIYAPDAETGELTMEDEDMDEPPLPLQKEKWQPLMDDLTQNYLAALAELAVAYCPTRGLTLENIAQLQVIGVDERGLTLQVLVARKDEGGCVALAIPISFPHPCPEGDDDDEGFKVCVMQNLATLYNVVKETERVRNKRQALKNATAITDYPAWWAGCGAKDKLASACESVCNLLNEDDLHEELRVLVGSMFFDTDSVGAVATAAVCPTGVFFRATVSDGIDEVEFDIPIPFGKNATTLDEVHAAVLRTVESDSQS